MERIKEKNKKRGRNKTIVDNANISRQLLHLQYSERIIGKKNGRQIRGKKEEKKEGKRDKLKSRWKEKNE